MSPAAGIYWGGHVLTPGKDQWTRLFHLKGLWHFEISGFAEHPSWPAVPGLCTITSAARSISLLDVCCLKKDLLKAANAQVSFTARIPGLAGYVSVCCTQQSTTSHVNFRFIDYFVMSAVSHRNAIRPAVHTSVWALMCAVSFQPRQDVFDWNRRLNDSWIINPYCRPTDLKSQTSEFRVHSLSIKFSPKSAHKLPTKPQPFMLPTLLSPAEVVIWVPAVGYRLTFLSL